MLKEIEKKIVHCFNKHKTFYMHSTLSSLPLISSSPINPDVKVKQDEGRLS